MTSKLTAKNLLNYIKTTRDKYRFQAQAPDNCPIACYLKSLGYRDPEVFGNELYYTDHRGERVGYSAEDSRKYPAWILDFVTAYDESNPKHRLATAAKVLERVVAKQSKRKVSSR
jgi:hypothetical protein